MSDHTYNDADGNPRCSCCGSHVRVVGGKVVYRIPDAPATMTHADDIAATAARVIALDKAVRLRTTDRMVASQRFADTHPGVRGIEWWRAHNDATDTEYELARVAEEQQSELYRTAAPMLAAEVLRLQAVIAGLQSTWDEVFAASDWNEDTPEIVTTPTRTFHLIDQAIIDTIRSREDTTDADSR